jgi:Helicase conserved C-terminal domain
VLDAAEEEEIATLEAEQIASNLAGTETTADLLTLIQLGEAAGRHDPKLAALVLEIRLIRLENVDANILVYTEYADSQQAAVDALSAAGLDGTILTISGADPEFVRTRSAERCAEEDRIILVSTDSLAEGLNLHQRCCHLIHLDLPYNPNRLEQRNGRIDRYGQRNDPQIRYFYLAGTFEERLLLRLIAKYEKARACLVFMPNTLGVGADPDGLHEPLFAGFAEDAPTLFGNAPRLIHSLDLAAEDSDGAAYRELLREIDRAFTSFDHMAVRHGWMAGAVATDQPVEFAAGTIDLPAFVASTLSAGPDGYRVPIEWTETLEGLAGFDRASGTVRLTNDPNRWRNADGQEVMYPGRSHPLTRRAIALARTAGTGRTSVARGHSLSLVMTYMTEVGARSDTLFRQTFALRVFPNGLIREQTDFLALSEPTGASDDAQPNDGLAHEGSAASNLSGQRVWRSLFAGWATDRIAEAGRVAAVTAASLAEGFAAAHLQRIDRDAAVATAWLNRRTLELCGAVVPWIGDLFDAEPPVGHWRSNPAAEQRLAGFAIDPSVPVSHRRDAEGTLSRFRAIMSAQPVWSSPVTRTLGMLMLCP